MKQYWCISLFVAIAFVGCKFEPIHQIMGRYVPERNIGVNESFKDSVCCDTIFITPKNDGYQVDERIGNNGNNNTVWQEHVLYRYKYDEANHSLDPAMPSACDTISIDIEKGLLSFEKRHAQVWKKLH